MTEDKTGTLKLPIDESAKHRVLDPESIYKSLKTKEPIIGGAIVLGIGISVLVVTIAFFPRRMEDISPPFYPTESSLSYVRDIFYVCGFLSLIGIIGGSLAMLRRYYTASMVGAAASVVCGLLIFYVIGVFVGLAGMALISISREQFRTRPPKALGPPFPQ